MASQRTPPSPEDVRVRRTAWREDDSDSSSSSSVRSTTPAPSASASRKSSRNVLYGRGSSPVPGTSPGAENSFSRPKRSGRTPLSPSQAATTTGSPDVKKQGSRMFPDTSKPLPPLHRSSADSLSRGKDARVGLGLAQPSATGRQRSDSLSSSSSDVPRKSRTSSTPDLGRTVSAPRTSKPSSKTASPQQLSKRGSGLFGVRSRDSGYIQYDPESIAMGRTASGSKREGGSSSSSLHSRSARRTSSSSNRHQSPAELGFVAVSQSLSNESGSASTSTTGRSGSRPHSPYQSGSSEFPASAQPQRRIPLGSRLSYSSIEAPSPTLSDSKSISSQSDRRRSGAPVNRARASSAQLSPRIWTTELAQPVDKVNSSEGEMDKFSEAESTTSSRRSRRSTEQSLRLIGRGGIATPPAVREDASDGAYLDVKARPSLDEPDTAPRVANSRKAPVPLPAKSPRRSQTIAMVPDHRSASSPARIALPTLTVQSASPSPRKPQIPLEINDEGAEQTPTSASPIRHDYAGFPDTAADTPVDAEPAEPESVPMPRIRSAGTIAAEPTQRNSWSPLSLALGLPNLVGLGTSTLKGFRPADLATPTEAEVQETRLVSPDLHPKGHNKHDSITSLASSRSDWSAYSVYASESPAWESHSPTSPAFNAASFNQIQEESEDDDAGDDSEEAQRARQARKAAEADRRKRTAIMFSQQADRMANDTSPTDRTRPPLRVVPSTSPPAAGSYSPGSFTQEALFNTDPYPGAAMPSSPRRGNTEDGSAPRTPPRTRSKASRAPGEATSMTRRSSNASLISQNRGNSPDLPRRQSSLSIEKMEAKTKRRDRSGSSSPTAFRNSPVSTPGLSAYATPDVTTPPDVNALNKADLINPRAPRQVSGGIMQVAAADEKVSKRLTQTGDKLQEHLQAEQVALTHRQQQRRGWAIQELLRTEAAFATDMAILRDVYLARARGMDLHAISKHISEVEYAPPTQPMEFHEPGLSHSTATSERLANGRISSTAFSPSASFTSSFATLVAPSTTSLDAPLSAHDIKKIFLNLEDVASFSERFSTLLHSAQGTLGQQSMDGQSATIVGDTIGATFVEMLPRIQSIYTRYCSRHDAAIQRLSEMTPFIGDYLAECRDLCRTMTNAWDLASLLIKPVQRVLKYPLLIDAILSNTASDHPDYNALRRANEAILAVAEDINEAKRRHELIGKALGRGSAKSASKVDVSTSKATKKRPENSHSRASLSSVTKKFGRASQKARQELGMDAPLQIEQSLTHLIEELDAKEAAIRNFRSAAKAWSRSVAAYLASQISLLEQWALCNARIDVSAMMSIADRGEKSLLNSALTVIRLSVADWQKMDIQLRALLTNRIDPLLILLKNPRIVIANCQDKLLDKERYKNAKGSADRAKGLEAATACDALTLQLTEELPRLCVSMTRYFDIVLVQWAQIQAGYFSKSHAHWASIRLPASSTDAPGSSLVMQWWLKHKNASEVYEQLLLSNDSSRRPSLRESTEGDPADTISLVESSRGPSFKSVGEASPSMMSSTTTPEGSIHARRATTDAVIDADTVSINERPARASLPLSSGAAATARHWLSRRRSRPRINSDEGGLTPENEEVPPMPTVLPALGFQKESVKASAATNSSLGTNVGGESRALEDKPVLYRVRAVDDTDSTSPNGSATTYPIISQRAGDVYEVLHVDAPERPDTWLFVRTVYKSYGWVSAVGVTLLP
ncbi:uncharacterized protein L969DRAFT_25376 [Mixia osmundae IAM 14324]|uniref:DH domain-containing protein n=1 Tax=Mixia osmundae (strain CBS 9802 / IAM 14324 / JCM 22182 / KY 12970) TaxID=764103 RepID=G7DWT0_MIXOS|nr:uncharacterized protein L969DRAFT_55623 [Mixia osmundae IAM 14324]XP_014566423.1 uncharacterized protein L969DRAFT_25376 [Mixia osmundae IAM 14324]KEI36195.1 hypothetical protein L969DRAFT_55623 [Mixia osmundae IAM 14324]KEI38163.1 hypothetical protein L969DRAFT_25376 [Mixia osmundae IAM 14324]GAA95027.1 hypothetical protein E5Q_01682 [Mixia osmundae IAM 14324]